MPARSTGALFALRRVSHETTDLFDKLSRVSERATDRTSEVLVGVLGAATFLMLAFGVSIAIPAMSFALGGPIAACIGLPAGILGWRGRKRFYIERELQKNRLTADEILDRIKSLPRNAPKELIDALYHQYYALTASLPGNLLPSTSGQSPAPLALPKPAEIPIALPAPDPQLPQLAPVRAKNEKQAKGTKKRSK